MDYGGAAAWLISFTLYVQHESGRRSLRCPSWDSILMTGCVAWLCNSMREPTVQQCNHYGKCSLCCLSGGDLRYFLPAHAPFRCIKAEPEGSRQMLNGCFVLSTFGGFFSLEVISGRSHITTHFDVIAYSCDWQISGIRSSVDIWKDHRVAILFCVVVVGETKFEIKHSYKSCRSFKGLIGVVWERLTYSFLAQ